MMNRVRFLAPISCLLYLGCQGPPGTIGEAGVACWDLNGNGVADPKEDANGDGAWTVADCVGTPGAPGLACWDLDGDGVADPEEDVNGDGAWTVADCAGSAGGSGLACWDLNGNGVADPEEDVNGDGAWTAADCAGSSGTSGGPGLACWDLDGNGVADPEEDVNGDGGWTVADCAGTSGAPGLACWDLNGDGVANDGEDTNGDLAWDAQDCTGGAGSPGLSCWDTNGDGVANDGEDTNGDGIWNSLDCAGTGELPVDTTLERWDDLPGIEVEILGLSGATSADGTFQIGDTVSVTFTARLGNGRPLALAQLSGASAWIAGPTSGYQRVIPGARNETALIDVAAHAVANLDGSYTYTFATPIPATYGSPLYDTTKFSDGERTGEALAKGTYTVALRAYKDYTVEGDTARDAGYDTFDFPLGGAVVEESREVVTTENCNQCHSSLRFHGGTYRSTRLCVTCHTAGAEDLGSTDTGDATPVTIEFKVLVHKLHNGEHLPSVVGVTTNDDGTRSYSATPTPYVVGGVDQLDFSEVGFPVWPNLNIAMPRDIGYSGLSTTNRALDDQIRKGVTRCEKCHGDPDDDGPLAAPAQGDNAYDEPSRRVCGACHDDVRFTVPYKANGLTMPDQEDDSFCHLCHASSGTALSVKNAHQHPLYRSVNPGFKLALLSAVEAGANDGDGTVDPGEKVSVTFSMTNDAGANVAPSSDLSSVSVALSGPTSNYNLLLYSAIPVGALGDTAKDSYTVNLPEAVILEYVGRASDDAIVETLRTARAPHWNVTGAVTTVYERTATTGGSTETTATSAAGQNYLDIAVTSGFAKDDYVVIDDGAGAEEYGRIGLVDGARLWFYSGLGYAEKSGLRHAHAAGVTVKAVTLTAQGGGDYTLTAATGALSEVGPATFAAGAAIVVSYTSDFVMPSVYPPPLNDSPDLDETWGEWAGKPIVDGTYSLGLWSGLAFCVAPDGHAVATSSCTSTSDNTSYRAVSKPARWELLVGSATVVEAYDKISSGESCYACHDDLYFHGGGRRGFATCILCHGTAGAEDKPRYLNATMAATSKVTVNYRTMLHKIHMGENLTHADTYTVNGNSSGTTFGEIAFPAMPGGVAQCTRCHGTATAWTKPAFRGHPSAQIVPVREWRAACGSCHDSDPAQAHIDLMTASSGLESCEVCHGPGRDYAVEVMHRAR